MCKINTNRSMRRKKAAMLGLTAIITAAAISGCASASSAGGTSAGVTTQDTQEETTSSDESDSTGTEEIDTQAGDTSESDSTAVTSDGTTLITDASDLDYSDMFTDRDLSGEYDEAEATVITLSDSGITVSGDGAEAEGTTLTITAAGTYIVRGTLSDGQIIVEADDENDKIQIVLDGVTITNDDSACILIKSADKVFVTLAEGTENSLSDTGAEYVQADDSMTVDAVIFSKSDLVLNGSGSLTVTANYNHGIVSKDDLKVTGGTYEVSAAGKGIVGKDSVRIADGVLTITSEDDAIHSSNDGESGKGYVYIEGGNITISSGDDGIHAATALIIEDGEINILKSYEGLEGDTVDIDGGNIVVNASDDGINAAISTSSDDAENGFAEGGFPGGNFGDGSMPTDGEMPEMPTDGEMPEMPTDGEMPEMTEAQENDSTSDTQTDKSAFGKGNRSDRDFSSGGGQMGGGQMGFGMMDVQSACYIHITGGNVTVNADGDGVDSNGSLIVDGGTIIIYGPTNSANGAIDIGTTAVVNGGTVLAAGASGMAETFSSDSAQYSFLYTFSGTVDAGTEVTIQDSNGNVVATVTPEKSFSCIVVSTEDLQSGEYTITAGSVSETFTLESTSTTVGTSGGGWMR